MDTKCKGAKFVSEIFNNDTSKYKTYWGKPLKGSDYANPCGLTAKAFFNDTFSISDKIGNSLYMNETGIANYYEKSTFYKRLDNHTDAQWMDVENEHFIVWMGMETFNDFRKLWARIDMALSPSTYYITVNQSYFVSKFNANKSIIVSTSSPFGSSTFYGWALLIAAAYCLFNVVALWVLLVTNKDKKFDYSVLKWKSK